MIIRDLRDKDLRESSPKQLVEAIDKAKTIAGANTLADQGVTLRPKEDSVELLAALIDLLDWEQPRRNDDFDPSYGLPAFPAIHAITVMRKAALPALVDVLETQDVKSIKYKNALVAVRVILSRDDTQIVSFLRDRASQATSEKGKQNLLRAAERILTEQRNF